MIVVMFVAVGCSYCGCAENGRPGPQSEPQAWTPGISVIFISSSLDQFRFVEQTCRIPTVRWTVRNPAQVRCGPLEHPLPPPDQFT
jgi:hypothetical protein